jgi:hypothetical protein
VIVLGMTARIVENPLAFKNPKKVNKRHPTTALERVL